MTNYEDWYLIEAWPGKRNVPTSCCLPEFANNTGEAQCQSQVAQSVGYTVLTKTGVQQLENWGSLPSGIRNFSVCHNVWTRCVCGPLSFPSNRSNGVSLTGLK